MLIAVQIRLENPLGKYLYASYEPQPLIMYGLIGLITFGLALIFSRRPLTVRVQITHLIASLLASISAILVLLPDVSQLQMIYCAVAAVILAVSVIVIPARLLTSARQPRLLDSLIILWQNRTLLRIWTANNVQARYSQAVLGILWIILLPLSLSLIFSFVFSQIIHMDVGNAPFISFFLVALIPWNLFSQGLINSTSAITNFMTLINQVYFPREVLVLVRLSELLVDISFTFVSLLVIDLLVGIWPNAYYVYLPDPAVHSAVPDARPDVLLQLPDGHDPGHSAVIGGDGAASVLPDSRPVSAGIDPRALQIHHHHQSDCPSDRKLPRRDRLQPRA